MGKTWKDDKFHSGADQDEFDDEEDLNKALGKIGQDIEDAPGKGFDINAYLKKFKADLWKTPGCHEQGRTVFKIGNLPVRAAGYMYDDFKHGPSDTLLVLTSHYKAPKAKRVKFSEFVKQTPPTVVKLSWPDYGVPNLDRRNWEGILKKITAPGKPITVFCDGGHGRTGSALAILYGLTYDNKNTKEVLNLIRKSYCRKAVETVEQERYVDAMLKGKKYVPLPKSKEKDTTDDLIAKYGTAVEIKPKEEESIKDKFRDDKAFWAWYERTHPGAFKKIQ